MVFSFASCLILHWPFFVINLGTLGFLLSSFCSNILPFWLVKPCLPSRAFLKLNCQFWKLWKFNPYWQIMENSSRNFSEIFIFRVVTQAVLLENSSIKNPEYLFNFFDSWASHRPFYWKTHPFEFFDCNHIWYVTFGLDEFSSKAACVTPQNSPIDDWMSFSVQRSSSVIKKLNRYSWFLMDEFSSKTACVTPQNSPIDDWMSFPVKRSGSRPGF